MTRFSPPPITLVSVLAAAVLAAACASTPPAAPSRSDAGTLAIVRGDWKYIQPSMGQPVSKNTNTELGNAPAPQLYDLSSDPGERQNVAAAHPDVVKDLSAPLQKIRQEERSR
jgi:hypothetical protein